MNSIINKSINLHKLAKSLKYNYSTAHPYPHCVIDELINSKLLNQVTKEFLIDKHHSVGFGNPNEKKITLNNWDKFGPETKKIINYLNSKPFIRFLENLTGIRNLISDNKLEGGGLHQINPGGYLKIHADFNKSISNLDRRLNVLLYLNKDWKAEWGGDFEMWSKDMKSCGKKISPIFNRTVIFSTTDFSYHGHPSPLMCPKGYARKSIALYYYTEGRPSHEIQKGLKYHSTLFVKRKGLKRDIGMFLYNRLNKLKFKSIIKLFLPKRYVDLISSKRKQIDK